MNTANAKTELRSLMRDSRRNLDPEWATEAGRRAQQLTLGLRELESAEIVCCYIAMPGEVGTNDLLKELWRQGKTVCVPAFREETMLYELALYEDGEPLASPHLAPQPERPRWLDLHRIKRRPDARIRTLMLIIVPGLAFDRAGNRLGRGRGYYDRILSYPELESAFKAGLSFEFQLLKNVPAMKHDVSMDAIVTEERVYHVRKK